MAGKSFMKILCVTIMVLTTVRGTENGQNKMLLFLMDGLRWDYFDQPDVALPGFQRIIKSGVRAECMRPDFPSLSYPNYYSIMTGLHCEDHGMVANYMYDEKIDKYFLLGGNPDHTNPVFWNDGEPLWVTAEKQGKKAYMYHWPGCEVHIRGVNPTHCIPYYDYPKLHDMKNDVELGLQVLENGSADLVGIYIELPDKYGHMYGPKSTQLNHVLQEMDTVMNDLMDKIQSSSLRGKVNILMFSDHGMTDVHEDRVVNITDAVDATDVKIFLTSGANAYIWPKDGMLNKVYNDLKNMNNKHLNVYKKEEIPERWFLKKHYRTSPILLVAETGWYIVTPASPNYYMYNATIPLRGTHGYDNTLQDMGAFFIANGPDFKSNHVHPPFANIHLYEMMCQLMGITPSKNDGDLSKVSGMLVANSGENLGSFIISFMIFFIYSSIVMVI